MTSKAEGTVVLGFLALIAVPVIGGGIYFENALQDRAVDEIRDRTFATSCSVHKELTTWQRWTTPLGWNDSWCEKYLDRM